VSKGYIIAIVIYCETKLQQNSSSYLQSKKEAYHSENLMHEFIRLTSVCLMLSFERESGQYEESNMPSESSLLVLLLPIALNSFKRGPYTRQTTIKRAIHQKSVFNLW